MVKVAIFISGRIKCYDTDLYSCLQYLTSDKNLELHLFASINDERNSYCVEAEQKLSVWLKDIQYEIYTKPENSYCESAWYNVLSCFYNDKKAYDMIMSYSEKNSIEYDYICKFRSDISFIMPCSFKFPEEKNEMTLYSCVPPDRIYFNGNKTLPMNICDAFAFGSPYIMKRYCKTYDFILQTLKERMGDYRVWFELSLTESFYDTTIDKDTPNACEHKVRNLLSNFPIHVNYFSCPYTLNINRRAPIEN